MHLFSVCWGISLGVAVIITVMSVMNGFQIEVKERILNLLPHASITYAQASQDKETIAFGSQEQFQC